jgi:CheY-like chemotaxis protein
MSGRHQDELTTFDLWHTARLVTRAMAAQARRKGIKLQLEIHPDTPRHVRSHAGKLRTLMAAMAETAVQSAGAGNVAVKVWPDQCREAACPVTFSVTGTGSQRRNTSGEEAGAGLAACKDLVEELGGSIRVESVPGLGFSFRTTIALERAVPPREAGAGGFLAKAERPRPLTILLAEDNELNQRFIVEFLEQRGHEVLAVPDGRQALDALAGRRFDLVLMDISMPVMDGLEATRAVREHDGSLFDPAIPIVAVTAHAVKGDAERFMAAGMNAYVAKPVDLNLLDRVVAGFAGVKATAAEPGSAPASAGDEPFDAALQRERFKNMTDFLPELLSLYRENSVATLDKIRQALGEKDLPAASAAAHTLKGMSAVVCASPVQKLSGEIETAAAAGDLGHCQALLEPLEAQIAKAVACLDASLTV